ncbi:MAG: EAL domain-containing protein [Burkholderiales bacterium]|nr:EAL domain-containing protein [Burkholderiales bacterium]
MPIHEPAAAPRADAPWWSKLHAALMPDYNRRASVYWWAMVLGGGALLLASMAQVAMLPPLVWLQVAVGMALAMLAGLFPVRVPGTRHSFVASDVFIFLLLLLHGPAAAAVAVAGEAAMGSMRSSRRWTSRIASPAIGTVAIVVAGSLLQALRTRFGVQGHGPDQTVALMALAMGTALLYFLLSATLFAGVLRLKRDEPFFQLADFVGVFRWVGMAYAGSAALAALLLAAYAVAGIGVWMVMLPLLAMLLATLHFYFRQQEATRALRERSAEAEAREAEAARRETLAHARHLRELQASERRFMSAFTHASIGMALLAFDGRVLQSNAAMSALLGRDAGDLGGRRLRDLVHEEHAAALEERLAGAGRGVFDGAAVELRFVRPDGGTPWAGLHFATFTETESGEPCFIVQAQDISMQRAAEEQLQHLAFHDTLTGLPNRRRFMQCLEGAVARSRADGNYAYAVMFLDFDRFKLVNDSLGHGAGDALLVLLARRLQERLRPSDVVARLGGDEFALLTERMGQERDVLALAERLMEALRTPFLVAGQELQISASIGITFGSVRYTSAEAVLRDADTAMYKAKAGGRARVALFDGSQHAEVSRRLRLEGELRRALDNGSLSVAYQPVFELQRGHGGHAGGLRALEALVRWRHPVEGPLAPAAFLPIAEECGLMPQLTDFVLHTACRQVRAWQLSHAAWAELAVSINIAAEDLAQPGFAARVQAVLLESGLRGEHLTLELTENILMSRIDGAMSTLAELRRLGVRVAVDDFGTGYSSLSYLARLPIDTLKIDRSFVADLARDGDQAAVVRAIVHLGQSLRKAIVAEGIEDSHQLEQLLALGCTLGQGHHLAEPLDVAATSELLARERGAGREALRLH